MQDSKFYTYYFNPQHFSAFVLKSPPGHLLLVPRGQKWFSAVLPPQLQSNHLLDLSDDYVVRNPPAGLVIRNHLRLLVDFCGQIFLTEPLRLPPLLDDLTYI